MSNSEVMNIGGQLAPIGTEQIDRSSAADMAAAIAKEKSVIEARMFAAMSRPRNLDQWLQRMQYHCSRPRFAADALYARPVGREKNKVTGEWEEKIAIDFSIRFAEQAMHEWQHLETIDDLVVTNDWIKVRVGLWDLCSNNSFVSHALVPRTVERHDRRDRAVRGVRETSSGKSIYIVEATPAELRSAIGAERSKLLRDIATKRIFPRYMLDDLHDLVDQTNTTENARDPDAARKKIFAGFLRMGVTAEMLGQVIKLEQIITPQQLAELTAMMNALKETDTTWVDIVRAHQQTASGPEEPKKRQKLKERIMGEAQQQQAAPAEPAPPAADEKPAAKK